MLQRCLLDRIPLNVFLLFCLSLRLLATLPHAQGDFAPSSGLPAGFPSDEGTTLRLIPIHPHAAEPSLQASMDSGSALLVRALIPSADPVMVLPPPDLNSPPVIISAVTNQTINIGQRFTTTLRTIEPDFPGQSLSFQLLQAPSNVLTRVLRGTNFLVAWTPSRENAGTTNRFVVKVTDSGQPSLSSTQQFQVVVTEFAQVAIGTTVVLAGQDSCLGIAQAANEPVTNIQFTVTFPAGTLTNLSIQPIAPQLCSSNLTFLSPTQALVRLSTCAGQPLDVSSGGDVADLCFTAVDNQPTRAATILIGNSVVQTASGRTLTNRSTQVGRVVISGEGGMLEASLTSDRKPQLILYGRPGRTYQIEGTTNVHDGASWRDVCRVPLTGPALLVCCANLTDPRGFFRAYEFSVGPTNEAPTIDLPPQLVVREPEVLLVGRATDDGLPAACQPLTYAWARLSGPGTAQIESPTSLVTRVTLAQRGSHVFRLSVGDSQDTNSASIQVIYHSIPHAEAGPDQFIALGNPAVLSGTASDDGLPLNTLTSWWTQVSGPLVDALARVDNQVARVSFSAAGDYVFRFSVFDGDATVSDDVRVVVGDCAFANQGREWRRLVTGHWPGTSELGSVSFGTGGSCNAVLTEGQSFVTGIERVFTLPLGAEALRLRFEDLRFDRSSGPGMGDTFEVSLVDMVGSSVLLSLQGGGVPNTQAAGSISPLPPLLDGLFQVTEGFPPALTPGTALVPAGPSVTTGVLAVDVRTLVPGIPYTLVIRLLNNDVDTGSRVTITEVSVGAMDSGLDLRGSPPPALSTLLAGLDARPCGVDSFSFSGFEPQLVSAVQGRPTPGDRGVLRLTLRSPAQHQSVPVGPRLLEAEVVAVDLSPEVRAFITVNGQPVDYIDERGQVLSVWQVLPGRNVLEWVAKAPGYSPVTNTQIFVGAPCTNGVFGLEDVTSRIGLHFRRTSFNPSSQRFYVETVLSNASLSTLHGPVFVGSRALSAPGVRLVGEDGFSEDGLPYYDFSVTIPPDGLPPGGVTAPRTLAFFNPDRLPFRFDAAVLGRMNRAPEFRTAPLAQAIVGQPYEYLFLTADPDGDPVSHQLVVSPSGMALDAARRSIRWTPGPADLGVHQVRVQAQDDQGGAVEQGYLLRVGTLSSNRPPRFVSDPVATHLLGQSYLYVARAEDSDRDPLRYSLRTGPIGMTVGGDSGEVRWNGGLATGAQSVVLEVSDGRGGATEQRWVVQVIGDPDNQPPVITSQPFPFFEYAGPISIPQGTVTPAFLDLPLRNGESFEGTVAFQLPATNALAGSADVAFVVDQSGSMAGEQAWIGDMIDDLDRALTSRGIGPNRYALVGFSHPGGQEYSHLFPVAGGPWTVSIYRPDNVLLASRTFSGASNPLPVPLPVDGMFRVVVSGGTDPNPISYQMLTRRETNGPSVLVFDDDVQGAITSPGEQREYRFVLTSNRLLYVDALHPSAGLVWNLFGPPGQVVRDRSFGQTDSNDQDGAVLNLIAGSYRLVVSGSGNAVGPFRFRVLDLFDGVPLAEGETVNGQLSPPNRTAAYRLVANEGERLYVDVQAVAAGNTTSRLRLISPAGVTVGDAVLGTDLEVSAAPVTGVYSLLVEGRIGETNSRSFQLRVTKPLVTSSSLVVGQAVQSALSLPGEQQVYRFTVAQRAFLYLDSWVNTNRVVWTLTGPSGVVVDARRMDQSDAGDIANPVIDVVAGNYDLRVDGVGDFTGAYGFRILNLADAPTAGLNTPVTVSLERGFETQMLGFDGAAGNRWIFDSLTRTNLPNARWRLVGPYGGVFFGVGLQQDGGVQGQYQTGRYVVLVEGSRQDSAPGNFSFRVIPTNSVPVAPRDGVPLDLGELVQGNLVATNQVDAYRFTLTNRTLAYFDSLTHRSSWLWTLAGPAGTNVLGRRFDQSDSADQNSPVLDLVAGDYQLTVDATGTNVGTYSFRLSQLSQGSMITPDADISGALDPANRSVLYQFPAQAGERVYVDQRARSGGTTTARWRLVDPLGRIVRNELLSVDLESGPLVMSGTHALLLEGRGSETNRRDFTFRLQLHSTNELPLTLDQAVFAQLARVGEEHTYVFRLSQRELLYFDSLTNQSSLTWTLIGPSGTVINALRFDRSDSFDNSDPMFTGFPGLYRLTVSASANGVGGYAFALRRPGVAPVLSPNTTLSGRLDPPNSTRLYQVEVAAGARIYGDMILLTGGATSSRWRWFDPVGSPLVTANLDADFVGGPAEHAGTYLLAVEGRVNETVSRDFSLKLNQYQDSVQTLASAVPISGEISSPGEQDTYTVSLPERTLVYVDSLSNSGLHWTLDGPSGVVVNARRFDSTDSTGFDGTPVLDLVAGDYRFTVAGASGQMGTYAFRWLPLSSASAIETGRDTAGQLDPAHATRLYRFSAAPGERIYLDMRTVSGANTGRWRLMDPFGQVAAVASLRTDLELLALPQGGDYTLLIEGAPADATPRDFVFRLDLSRPAQAVLAVGQRIQGSVGRAGEETVYEFDLAGRSLLYLDALAHTNTLVWSLNGPAGLIVDRRRFDQTDAGDNSNPLLDLPAGRYRMTVDGVAEATSSYAFRWLDLSEGSPISIDTVTAVELDPANETRVFRLDAAAGERLTVDALTRTNLASARMRLVSPYGAILFNVALGTDVPNVALNQSGAYSLLIEGSRLDALPGSARFRLVPTNGVPIPPLLGTPLALGQPVEGTLIATNQVDSYRFNLVGRSLLYFDSRTFRSGFIWSLRGSAGSNVVNRRFDQSDSADLSPNPTLDLVAGEYQLSVDGVGTNVGSYRFVLSRLEEATELLPGVPVELSMDPPNSTQLYRFDGGEERLYLNGRGLTGGTTTSRWRLLNRLGQVLGDAVLGSDIELGALALPGQHFLLVEGRIGETAARTLTFTLQLNSDSQQSLTLGELNRGSIGASGERDVYVFRLTKRTQLYFDSVSPTSSLTWSLEGPAGVEVSARPFSTVDPSNPLSLLDLVPGEYRLTVDGVGDATSAYQFRVLEPSRLNPGTATVSQIGALESGLSADVFWLEGRTGERLILDYGEAGSYFGSAALFAGATRLLSTSGSGVEDGYDGVAKALAELPFRPTAAANLVLVTDEDRDVVNASITLSNLLTGAANQRVRMNTILDGPLRDGTGTSGIGLDALGNAYLPDGSGGFQVGSNGVFAGAPALQQQYVPLAFETGGATWDLNLLRQGGSNALSFTRAFVEVNVEGIERQLRLELITSDPSVVFSNRTGIVSGIGSGDTARFTYRVTRTGDARAFELQFIRPGTTNVIGSIPVRWSLDYVYPIRALDPEGDPVRFKLVNGPTGAAVDPITGLLRWRGDSPDPVSFAVRVEDGRGGSTVQEFTIRPSGTNRAPLFEGALPSLAGVNRLFSAVLGARDPDQDPLLFEVTNAPAGMILDSQTGRIQWRPTESQLGRFDVQFRVLDGRGGSAVLSHRIDVRSTLDNVSPVFVSSAGQRALAGRPYVYEAHATDANADALRFEAVLAPTGLVVGEDGVVSWVPSLAQLGSHVVAIRALDPFGGVAVQSYTLEVTAENSAPIISSASKRRAVANHPYRYEVRAQDAEDSLFSFQLSAPVALGLTLNTSSLSGFTASLEWTPSSAQLGSYPVEVRVTDPSGAEARQSFVIEVVSDVGNQPPVFVSQPRTRTHLNGNYGSVVWAEDPEGDLLSFTLVSAPAGMRLVASAEAPLGAAMISWQPGVNDLGSHRVQLRVTDGRGGSADLHFAVQVETSIQNQGPTITSRPVSGAAVGEVYRYDLRAVDPESDPLRWSIVSGPTGLSIDPILGTLRWVPRSDQVGQPTVVVEVRDSYGEPDIQEFQVDVLWANRPPQITSVPSTEAQLGTAYLYLPRGADPDGDALTWRMGAAALPPGMALDSRSGAVTWTPTAAQAGPHVVELVVSDGRGGETTQRYTLYAFNFNANRSPAIVSNPLRGAGVGRPYTYVVEATDADGDVVSIEPVRLPAGATLTPVSAVPGRTQARLVWTPASAGSETVILVARDPARASGAQQFNVVARPNSPPQLVSRPKTNAVPGLLFTDVIQAVDAENDRLSFAVQGPAGMSVDNLGRIRWLPAASATGSFPVTWTVTDEYGASSSQQSLVRLAADQEPPVVTLQVAYNLTDSQGVRFVRAGTEVAIRVDATDNVGVEQTSLAIGQVPVVLSAEGLALVEFPVSEDVDLIASAVDASGNRTSITNRVFVVDPNAVGTVQILLESPTNSAVVTRPVPVIASVTSSAELRNYVLEVAPLDGDFASAELNSSDPRLRFRVLGRGTFPANTLSITNATLGRFDPTRLINGGYVLRLSVFDRNGQGRQEAAQVSVAGSLKFGELAVEYVDLEVPLAGIPITITRAYDSRQSDRSGDFGHGWSLAVQDGQVLETGKKAFVGLGGQGSTFTVKTRVYLTAPDGRRLGFTFQPQFATSALVFGAFYRPAFVSDPGVLDRLEPLEAPAAYQVRSDGSFTSGFGLVGYDPSGYRLRTREGLVYEYDQAFGLRRVQDPTGNRVEYRSEGVFHYPAGATQPDESIAFVRDAAGRISEIVDPAGKRLRYEYDAVGDLRRFTDQVGNTVRFDYHGLQPHLLTNVVDALGNAILRAEFDANGVLLAVRDGAGNPIRQQFDSDSLTGVLTDGNGHTTRSVYDDRGNEVRRVDALGGVTEFEYDANDNEVLQRDARGVVTRKTYDSQGNLTSIVDGLGNVTRLTYGSLGRATMITGPGGATVAFDLDSKGRVAGVAHALGAVARRTYDAQGRLSSVSDFNGYSEQLQYDNGCACGSPSRIVQPDGSVRSFEYNFLGALVREVDELGNETVLAYDDAGRVLSSCDPEGQVLRFTYRGNLLASRTDAMGRTTSFGYDTVGRITSITNPAGGVVRFQFDANGNRTQIQDPEGNVTTFRYDALNRVTEAIDPFGRAFTNRYDAVGNRTESIDRNGRRITMGYDAANRPTNEVWWDGAAKVKEILYRHDAEGQLVEARDGGVVEEFVFDPLSRLTQSTRRGVPGLPAFSLNYSYDAFTNILSVVDSMGFRVESTFDNRSRLQTRRWQGNGFSPVFARFGHDPAGRRTSVVRGLGLSGQQRVGESLYAYNRLSSTTNLTHRSAAGTSVLGLRYRHNAAQEVLERSLGTEVSRFAYDAAGQLTNVLHTAQPAEVYRYDLAQNRVGDDFRVGRNNRITEFQDWIFGYDGEGNTVSRSNRVSGLTTRYVYDHRNRMTDVVDLDLRGAEVRRTSFEYDLLNRRVTRTTGGQVARSVHNFLDVWADLDAQGNVVARYGHGDRPDEHHVRWTANGTPVWALLDDQETVLGVSDATGGLIAQRRYDSFGNILNPDESGLVGRFGFQGHEWDAETGLYYYRARYYDPVLGRFLQEDPLRQEGSLPNLYAFLNNSPPNYSDRFGLTAAIERGILSRIAIATARCVAKLGIDLAVDFAIEAVALDAASKVLGIYVYQRPDGKYYVGQSVDIRRRMAEHGDKVKRIVAVLQVTTKESSAANYLNNLEQALISALGGPNTKGNKNYGGILKNLREQLRAGNPKRLCWLFEAQDGQLYWIEVEIDWRTEPADGAKPDLLSRDVGSLG